MKPSRIGSGGFRGAVSRTLHRLQRPSRLGWFAGESLRQVRDLHAAAQGKVATLLKSLGTSLDGLSWEEVRRRQRRFGLNELVPERSPKCHVQWIRSFKNPLVALLAALGVVAILTHDLKTASVIGVMLTISVLLRFVQESRTTHTAEPLRAMVRNSATVTRNVVRRPRDGLMIGKSTGLPTQNGKQKVPLRELVPGDIVHLSAGDMIPADVRLVLSSDLFVSQEMLTGESMPVKKGELPIQSIGANEQRLELSYKDLLGMNNLCFMGTSVISGTATAVVLATGSRTYLGALARGLDGGRVATSFERGISTVSRLLV